MLFLAVSGVMFLIATNFINGKESQAEFSTSVGNVTSVLQQVIDNVANGYYPTQQNFNCTNPLGGGVLGAAPTFSSGSSSKGTNSQGGYGCVFLGDVIQFGVNGTNGSGYAVIPVVGDQAIKTPQGPVQVTNFSDAYPTPLMNSVVNMVNNATLEYGLRVTAMGIDNSPSSTSFYQTLSAIGIFTTFGSYGANNLLQSGAQDLVLTTVDNMGSGSPCYSLTYGYLSGCSVQGTGNAAATYYIQGIYTNDQTSPQQIYITDTPPGDVIPDTKSVVICMAGANNIPVAITIGPSDGQLSVAAQTGGAAANIKACP
jgi:hypothetical protein